MHKHVHEVVSIARSNVEMDDAVRQQLFAQDEMVAVIIVTNKIAVCAVSIITIGFIFPHVHALDADFFRCNTLWGL